MIIWKEVVEPAPRSINLLLLPGSECSRSANNLELLATEGFPATATFPVTTVAVEQADGYKVHIGMIPRPEGRLHLLARLIDPLGVEIPLDNAHRPVGRFPC